MAEEVGALRVAVRANTAEIAGDMAKIRGIVQTSAAQMQRGMMAFSKGANGAISSIFSMKSAVLALTGGAMVAFIKKSLDFADSLGETADMIGISAKALQELRYVAGLAGVSNEEFDKSMMQLSKRLGEAQLDVNEASKALNQLGITMGQIKGLSTDQVFKMISDRLPGVTDKMKQAQIVTDLFGKTGQKLLPTLLQGSDYLNKMAAEAHSLGIILDDETIKKASDANDEFDRMSSALKVAGARASAELLPALTELRKLFTSREFQDGVKSFATNLGDAIKWMVENKDTVEKVTAAFAGAFVGARFGPAGAGIGALLGLLADSFMQSSSAADEFTRSIKGNNAEIKRLVALREEAMNLGKWDLAKEYAKEIDEIQDHNDQLRESLASLGKKFDDTGDAAKRAKIIITGSFIGEAAKKEIDDLDFKIRILRGDFDKLAPGFPEAARGLKIFGTTAADTKTKVADLTFEQAALNKKFLELEAEKVIDSLKTSTQRYADEVNKLNIMQQGGKLTIEQYQAAVNKLRFPSLTKAIEDATDLNKLLDTFSTNSLNTTADALTDVVMGTKSAKEAFADMAKSIIRDIVAMTVKALVFRSIASVFGFSQGGGVGSFLGFRDGGIAGFADGGGVIRGPGSGTSDSILARVSNGEFIVNADATSKHADLLQAINDGKMPEFADGGMVRTAPTSQPAREVPVYLNGYGWSREDLRRFILDLNRVTKDGPTLLTPR